MTLSRATKETAWTLPARPKSMPSNAPAVFEVATIKRRDPNSSGKRFRTRGREVLTINTTLSDLMAYAFGVHGVQRTSKAIPVRMVIPLRDLSPGRYGWQVAVVDPGGRKAAFWQTAVAIVP